jgi:hypothetical protein
MIKNILTAGDSFTYGEELGNINQAWPYQLGKLLDANVLNLATPAASNDKILRVTMDHLLRPHNIDLVVIGWASPGRIEFSDEFGAFDVWPGYSGNLFKKDNMYWREDIANYVSRYHNSSYLHCRYFQQVILLQNYFKSLNIKYIMVNVCHNEYYKKINFDGMQDYSKHIDKQQFLDFETAGMLEWTNGCKKGPQGHFLDEGHDIVADKINEHIRNLGWLS